MPGNCPSCTKGAISSQLAPLVAVPHKATGFGAIGSRFYWVRTYDPLNGWATYYEGWDDVIARDFRAHSQAGALVIADIFDVATNGWLPREQWQSYSPGPGGGGNRTSTPWADGGTVDDVLPLPPDPKDWKPLTIGGDLPVKKGYWYHALASVKANHAKSAIVSTLQSKGLTVVKYVESGTGDYKNVDITAFATADGGSLPTKVPWPLSMADDTHVTKLEYAAKSGAPPISTTDSTSVGAWAFGLAAAGGLGYGGYRLYKRYKRLHAR